MDEPYCCEKKLLKLNEKFTCGQAQKWMNMTLKYLWLLDLLPAEIEEESLHVPIDSFILQKLKEEQVPGVTNSGETYYYKRKVWSAITDYERIHGAAKGNQKNRISQSDSMGRSCMD